MPKKIDVSGLDHYHDKVSAMVADEYSSSATYAVGDYCFHAGTLYKCTTAITTAEAWTSGHWTAAKLAEDTSELKTALTSIASLNLFNGNVTSGYYISASGTLTAYSSSAYTNSIPVESGKTYQLSYDQTAVSQDYNLRIHGYNSSDIWDSQIVAKLVSKTATSVSVDVTIPDGISFIKISFYYYSPLSNIVFAEKVGDVTITAVDKVAREDTAFLKTQAAPVTETVDVSEIGHLGYYIDGNNVWKQGYNCYFVPVYPNQKVTIKTVNRWGTVYAVLKDNSVQVNQTPRFCDDYFGRVVLAQNISAEIIVPEDCNYIGVRIDDAQALADISVTIETSLWSYAEENNKLAQKITTDSNTVYVAASNSTEHDKLIADFVCDGTNDEVEIQAAINSVYSVAAKRGTIVKLLAGDYYIDSFPSTNYDGHVAILLPSLQSADTAGTDTFAVTIEGCNYNTENTCIYLTQDCYDTLNTTDSYSIFACQNNAYYNHFAFHDIRIFIPSGQKNIICLDGMEMGSMEIRRCRCTVQDHGTWTTLPTNFPVFGCIGVRGAAFDSNSWNYVWEAVYCLGFGQGFAVMGEHLLAIKCVGIYGMYGFTFHANYHDVAKWNRGYQSSHPNTLIDCSDEGNANFWLFGAYNTRYPVVNAYNLSVEHYAAWFNIEGQGHFATEVVPGTFNGHIDYAITGGDVETKFWESGSGMRFRTINDNQKLVCTSADRTRYAAHMGQQIFDTTLNKEAICINPSCKKWVDVSGTVISQYEATNATGTISDNNGDPISGTITFTSCTDGGTYTAEAVNGSWSASLRQDRYNVTIDGYYVDAGSFYIKRYTTSYAIVAYSAHTVSGTVTGTIAENVPIYFVSTENDLWVFAVPRENGEYTMLLPDGTYEVKSQKTIVSPTSPVTISADTTVNISV